MLENKVLTGLLANDSYSPQMRDYYPVQFFRAELLKAIKYPEISYRKYCTEEYFGLDRKENREFIGLPLHNVFCNLKIPTFANKNPQLKVGNF